MESKLIFNEINKNPYSYQKMISVLRKQFYWPNMKTDTTDYLVKCLECQQVKVEHQHPVGLLHPFPIPEWKWHVISMDFIIGFPKSQKHHDSIIIMVVVDNLRKSAHFIVVKSSYKTIHIA
jgi:hypothetical protein